jgi:hypothetical protein
VHARYSTSPSLTRKCEADFGRSECPSRPNDRCFVEVRKLVSEAIGPPGPPRGWDGYSSSSVLRLQPMTSAVTATTTGGGGHHDDDDGAAGQIRGRRPDGVATETVKSNERTRGGARGAGDDEHDGLHEMTYARGSISIDNAHVIVCTTCEATGVAPLLIVALVGRRTLGAEV